ncbi:MAG TPA: PIG-L family deacetylase [Longimicrobiales bacterium]
MSAGVLLAAVLCSAAPAAAQKPETEYEGAVALGLALRRVGPTQRVLMIAAHPDDENTAVLATLALGRGADVAYLSLTRGDGGQNGIGPELQESIGLIRSEELLAARRLDGAAQFFTRAYDYGFSKSADEAFRHWPRDSVLKDVVTVIRRYRPDVVVSVFTGTPRDGHGQHQAAGLLAREAFRAAGDPARFPELTAAGLPPHRPAKLYLSRWGTPPGDATRLQTGTYDPLLGRSYHQVALASRSRHRSQDMGRALEPGPRAVALERVDAPAADEPSIFSGVDTTLAQRARSIGAGAALAALTEYDAVADDIRRAYNPLAAGALVADLARAIRLLDRAERALGGRDDAAAAALRFYIDAERDDVSEALRMAAGVVVDAVADAERVVPGGTFGLELTVWNGGTRPVSVHALEPVLPAGWKATPRDTLPGGPLAPGELRMRRFEVRVPTDAPPTGPYYLRRPRDGDLYRWPADFALRGLPFQPPEVRARALVGLDDVLLPIRREATYRHVSRTEGESRRPVRVVPAVSVALEPGVAVLPLGDGVVAKAAERGAGAPGRARGAGGGPGSTGERGTGAGSAAGGVVGAAGAAPGDSGLVFGVRLTGEAPEGIAGTLRLELPAGWRAVPAAVPVRFEAQGESRHVEFRVYPPADAAAGAYRIAVAFEAEDGRRYTRGYEEVDYPHIRPRARYRDAVAMVQAFDVRVPTGLRVGYIVGAGDEVPGALRQLGIALDVIDPADLGTADLDAYDVLVTGIRAYEHRSEIRTHNRRLLEWVERGGTLIVQYNQYTFSRGGFAPYALEIARPHDRVTDETAPVRLLDPSHPALSWPNRIGPADFDGWVQERGLYFPHTWDARYTPLLEMSDPGEDPLRGAVLVARYGKGTYVYTGLAFFRQLPAGVPGAYRLFANLIALGVHE